MTSYKSLGEVSDIIGGYAFKSGDFVSSGIPIMKIANISSENEICFGNNSSYINENDFEKYDKYALSKGDIVVALSGATTGKYGVIKNDQRILLNQRVARIRAHAELINPEFLYFYMNLLEDKIKNRALGAAQPNISTNELAKFQIPLPPLDVQSNIVEILKTTDIMLKNRQSQIAALDELTQSVFLEMFGDPETNPFDWSLGIINDLTLKSQYGTSKKAHENKGTYSILRMNNITYRGDWNLNDLKYIDLDEKECQKYLVHKGELLFNRTNSKELVGKTAVFRKEHPMAFAGYLVKLQVNDKGNSEFISAFLNSDYGKAVLLSKAKSIVGMANINAEELKKISIYLPPKKLQDEFACKIYKIIEYKEQLKVGLLQLEMLYSALLSKAFKGKESFFKNSRNISTS